MVLIRTFLIFEKVIVKYLACKPSWNKFGNAMTFEDLSNALNHYQYCNFIVNIFFLLFHGECCRTPCLSDVRTWGCLMWFTQHKIYIISLRKKRMKDSVIIFHFTHFTQTATVHIAAKLRLVIGTCRHLSTALEKAKIMQLICKSKSDVP